VSLFTVFTFSQNSKVPNYRYKTVTSTVEFLNSNYHATDHRTVRLEIKNTNLSHTHLVWKHYGTDYPTRSVFSFCHPSFPDPSVQSETCPFSICHCMTQFGFMYCPMEGPFKLQTEVTTAIDDACWVTYSVRNPHCHEIYPNQYCIGNILGGNEEECAGNLRRAIISFSFCSALIVTPFRSHNIFSPLIQ
jgi:hypothetical protein